MTKIFDVAETAKLARKRLKNQFPGKKFSVTIQRYSGGSTLHVTWTDAIAESAVKEATDIFAGRTFDGSQDLASNVKCIWEDEEVIFPHFVSLHRTITRKFIDRIYKYCQAKYSAYDFSGIYISESKSGDCRVAITDNVEWSKFEKLKGLIYQEIRDSSDSRVFDWDAERLERIQNSQAQRKLIEDQQAKDVEYLATKKVPNFATKNIGRTVNKQEYTWTNQEFIDYDDPIIPISVTEVDYQVTARIADLSGVDCLFTYQELNKQDFTHEICLVCREVLLSEEHYRRFTTKLLTKFDFLFDRGGFYSDDDRLPDELPVEEYNQTQNQIFNDTKYREVIAILASGQEIFVVDLQRLSYAVIVGFVKQDQIKASLETPLPEKVTDIRKYQNQKKDKGIPQTVNNLLDDYREWLLTEIGANRLLEIVDYHTWLDKHVTQEFLGDRYKAFLQTCITQDKLDTVMSFEVWRDLTVDAARSQIYNSNN